MRRIRKQAREAEQRSQWRFLLGVSAAVTNIFSPARDQWISFCVLPCSGRQRTNNNNYKKSAPIRHVAACRVEHAASSRGISRILCFVSFHNIWQLVPRRPGAWQHVTSRWSPHKSSTTKKQQQRRQHATWHQHLFLGVTNKLDH